MSDDGADLGVTAEAALNAILSGSVPPEEGRKSPEQMRAYLEAHAILTSEDDYSAATAHIGSIFLAYLQKHPEDQALDLDGEYDWTKFDPATGGFTSPDAIIRPSITDVMKEKEQAMADALHGHGFSGFMVGHGLNAAKYALGQSPVHNPAIVDLNV